MALDKVIAAKIGAYDVGWVDPEAFAECAKDGTIYMQTSRRFPGRMWGFFALGKQEKLPLEKLSDLNHVHHLHIVLTYDAIGPEMLQTIRDLRERREKNRKEEDIEGWDTFEGKGMFEVEVVADVGKDSETGEIRYGVLPIYSAAILDNLNNTEAMKLAFVKLFKNGSWATLCQVNEAIPRIKKRQSERLPLEEIHFTRGQLLEIVDLVRGLLKEGLPRDDIKSRIMTKYRIADGAKLDEFITDVENLVP